MPSLAILEGLIGTACAVTCLYYARLGALAGPQNSIPASVPWHSALGEYARRNPFAAVFGALALGFLVSSWSMYALPRSVGAQPRAIEKWHTVTKTVPTADPAQATKIATLQNTLNADSATIAGQNAEIDRLKQALAKFTTRRFVRPAAIPATNRSTQQGAAVDLNKAYTPANATPGAATNPPAAVQTAAPPPAAAPQNAPATTPAAAPPSSDTTPPH